MRNVVRDLRIDKLHFVLSNESLVKGLWDTIKCYGVRFSKENHELLVEVVSSVIAGEDIEPEWTYKEYTTFVQYKEVI
jgi:hypothetical protein